MLSTTVAIAPKPEPPVRRPADPISLWASWSILFLGIAVLFYAWLRGRFVPCDS
jgi:hypothetical protein